MPGSEINKNSNTSNCVNNEQILKYAEYNGFCDELAILDSEQIINEISEA